MKAPRKEKEVGCSQGKEKMVFHEIRRGKEAVVRDRAVEAGRGWIVAGR